MKVQYESKVYTIEFSYGETTTYSPQTGPNTTKTALLNAVRGVVSILKTIEAGTLTEDVIVASVADALNLIDEAWTPQRRQSCTCTIRDVTDFRRDPDLDPATPQSAPVVAHREVTRYYSDRQDREKQRKAALAEALDALFPPYESQPQRISSPEHRGARKLFWEAYRSRKAIRNHLEFLRKLEKKAKPGGAEA